jgi:hypothetical protein
MGAGGAEAFSFSLRRFPVFGGIDIVVASDMRLLRLLQIKDYRFEIMVINTSNNRRCLLARCQDAKMPSRLKICSCKRLFLQESVATTHDCTTTVVARHKSLISGWILFPSYRGQRIFSTQHFSSNTSALVC